MLLLWLLLETVHRTKQPLIIPSYSLVSWWFVSMTSQGGNRFLLKPLNISPGRSFFYFKVMSLLWELTLLFWEILNSYLSSWYPFRALAQEPVTKVIGLAEGPWGENGLAYILIVWGNKDQFPGTPTLVPALLGRSGTMFTPSYISAFTPLCLFHCWKTQNTTFLVHIVCLKIHLETCPIWKWLKLQKKHSCL